MTEQTFVIVGASLAGAKAAETLRAEGFDGQVVLVGAEQELPYERPPLSKEVLLGTKEAQVAQLHDQTWYDEQRVTLRLGSTVTAIDTGKREVALGGETLGYDKLLIATGSRVRPLDVPGSGLVGVRYLRTSTESRELLAAFKSQPRVVVVGAGWIGLEAASAAREHGAEVTVIEPQSTALAGVLGEQVGELFADLHRSHGVTFRFGTQVEEIEGDGKVTGVRTSDGDTVPADLVLVGIGVQPNTEFVREAGLEVDDGGGIDVDAGLRTSAPEVYAAGDVARWAHPLLGYPVRVEHWQNAQDSGAAAARSMLGQDVSYDAIPFFFTDQYDLGMEYVGDVPRGTSYDVVLRGDPSKGSYLAFYLGDGGRVLAGMHVNVWDSTDAIRELVRSKKTVDEDRLADSEVPLSEV